MWRGKENKKEIRTHCIFSTLNKSRFNLYSTSSTVFSAHTSVALINAGTFGYFVIYFDSELSHNDSIVLAHTSHSTELVVFCFIVLEFSDMFYRYSSNLTGNEWFCSLFRRDKLWICMEFCGGGSLQDIYHGMSRP